MKSENECPDSRMTLGWEIPETKGNNLRIPFKFKEWAFLKVKSYKKILKFYILYIVKMLLERKQEVLKTLDENYVIVRDEDGEVLCLLGRDDEWYYVYTFERSELTKAQAEALLDKAAWVALTPVVDEKIYQQYKEELEKMEKKISAQIEDDYFEEEE